MAEPRLFTVRPLSKQTRNDYKDAFRVHLSSTTLATLKLRAGELCSLTQSESSPKTAIAWTATENLQSTVVQTSRALQDSYGIKVGEKIAISKVDGPADEIAAIFLVECSDVERLSRCEFLTVGLVFELELKGHRRSFKISSIRSQNQTTTNTLFRYTENTKVVIGDDLDALQETKSTDIQVQKAGLGGLSRQIDNINESLADFNSKSRRLAMPSFYVHSRGILIYGPKGTGKSALLRQIQAAGWRKAINIGSATFSRNAGDAEARIRSAFQEAIRNQPSVVMIDQLEYIAPKRTSPDSQSLGLVLCECLDAAKDALVLVVAASRHPNDVDDTLRTPHRLSTEIELQIPTAQDRAEILRAIRGGSSNELSDELIELMAEKTHGYVGADLFALLQLVCRKARQRRMPGKNVEDKLCEDFSALLAQNEGGEGATATVPLDIQEPDVLSALQETRPTAMREVFLETPKVRWTDIGGQHDIKRHLQKAVLRPLKFGERMKRLNVNSKKGVLLYGPPGCSKTLTVKALATEAGLNFLAVKGAEILSMYVGESERSLREIFRKARSARPSIIFFDEIDAIASKRSSTSQGGVNVLTTLLNEMDGIEELRNVLVIAATNKPDVLDPALMRPGRLDNILYIGPPDFEARREIFKIWTSKSSVDPEVELEELASRTEGYSGAEIVSICETAGDAALDEEEETGQEQDVKLKHFEYALGQVKRQITDAVIQEYEAWGNGS